MTLSVHTFIEEGDILQIKALKRAKVHRVYGFLDDNLVLKWEPGFDKQRIKEGSGLIGVVDGLAQPVPLKSFELSELYQWCSNRAHWINRNRQLQNKPSLDKDIHEAAEDIKLNIIQKTPGYKLPLLQVRTLEDAMTDYSDNANKKPLQSFVKHLLATDGLEQLGRIVALDLIMVNTDRFYPDSRGTKSFRLGGQTIELDTVINIGNIMLATQGSHWAFSALDTFDPASYWNRAGDKSYSSAETAMGSNSNTWPVRYLVQPMLRHTYSKRILADLEKLFLPVRRSLFSVFGGKEVRRLEWGMVDGGMAVNAKLKDYVKSRTLKGVKPVERLTTLISELNKLRH